MGKLVTLDFNKKLPFDPGHWTISPWPLNSQYVGLKSNSIGNNQVTEFEITGKFEYLKIDFIIQSERNYDIFTVTTSKRQQIYTSKGCAQNQPISFEHNFNGEQITLIFAYQKDSSGSTAPDCVCIFGMQFKTVDDSLVQANVRYALLCPDGVYTLTDSNSLTKVGANIESMTKELWQSCSKSMQIFNIRNDITGPEPIALRYTDDIQEKSFSLVTKCIKKPDIIYTTNSYTFEEPYIKGLKNFEISYTAGEHDVLLFAFSIDDGHTWVTYKQGKWSAMPSLNEENLSVYGMAPSEVIALSGSSLDYLYTNKKLKVAFILKPATLGSELRLNNYRCNYIL